LEPLHDPGSPTNNGVMVRMSSTSNKKELVEAVRRLNPAGLNAAPGIFWDVEGSLKNVNIDGGGVKQQLTIVENGVNYSIKRYNDLIVLNDRLTRELKVKLDELDDQKKGYEQLVAMKDATTEEGVRIEQLKHEAKSIQHECDKKQHQTRQLEYMLLRLKQNQLKFDAHMTGMEETMRNISKEGMEIRLLRRGLDAGLAKAVAVYEETQANLATSRKDREVLLGQRKMELKTAQVLQQWMIQRAKEKAELQIELKGNLTRTEEQFLKTKLNEKIENTKSLQKATEESHRRLQSMEDLFAKLKQVTGVKTLEDMLEKFSSQKGNKKGLEMDVAEAEKRLAAAKKEYRKKETRFQELKSSGGGRSELSREYMEKMEEAILNSKGEQKLLRADSERLSAIILSLSQGAQGLLQRVGPHLHLSDGVTFELTGGAEEQAAWAKTLDALTTAEQVLAKMLETMSGDGATSPDALKLLSQDEEDDDHSVESNARSVGSAGEVPSMGNNVRIKSRKLLRVIEEVGAADATALSGFAASDTLDFGETEATQQQDSDPVLSRVAVKNTSVRTENAFLRKKELELRRKRCVISPPPQSPPLQCTNPLPPSPSPNKACREYAAARQHRRREARARGSAQRPKGHGQAPQHIPRARDPARGRHAARRRPDQDRCVPGEDAQADLSTTSLPLSPQL